MGFDIVRSAGCDADLDLIHDHLFNANRDFGDAPDIAFEREVERTRGIEDDMAALGNVPFQGTLEPQIMEGLRYATKGRAVSCLMVDEGHREVQVLGIFFLGRITGSTCLSASRIWRKGDRAVATILLPDQREYLPGPHGNMPRQFVRWADGPRIRIMSCVA